MTSKTVLVASLATTSAASFVAMCYMLYAQRDLQRDLRSDDRSSKPDDSIVDIDNRTPLAVKVESDEDDSRATTASTNNQDTTTTTTTKSGADSGTITRTISNIRENNIVVACSSKSYHQFEGTSSRSGKDNIVNDITDAVISTICQAVDADETELRSFRLSLMEMHCIQEPGSWIQPETANGLDFGNRGNPQRMSEEESCASRRQSETYTSIIISAEDWAMTQQLLLQMQENEELFGFGDEMVARTLTTTCSRRPSLRELASNHSSFCHAAS